MLPKSFLNNYLTIAFVLALGIANAQTGCKDIKATIEVFQAGQKGEIASVMIDFHGQSNAELSISLIGPKGYFKKDIQESEIKDLQKGTYTIVFSSKKEDNFCMKHFEVIIK